MVGNGLGSIVGSSENGATGNKTGADVPAFRVGVSVGACVLQVGASVAISVGG